MSTQSFYTQQLRSRMFVHWDGELSCSILRLVCMNRGCSQQGGNANSTTMNTKRNRELAYVLVVGSMEVRPVWMAFSRPSNAAFSGMPNSSCFRAFENDAKPTSASSRPRAVRLANKASSPLFCKRLVSVTDAEFETTKNRADSGQVSLRRALDVHCFAHPSTYR